MQKSKHKFAFYVPEIFANVLSVGQTISLKDKALAHRLFGVLRLQEGDEVAFFNKQQSVDVALQKSSNKSIVSGVVQTVQENAVLKPYITVLLPLLKRDALETAIYSAVECGANEIQLIITEKVQRKWGGQKEFDRLEKISIAAAEQAKHFIVPELRSPISFSEITTITADQLLFADSDGQSLQKILKNSSESSCALMIGPEGDLTNQEKNDLHNAGFIFCALTPTVLRASQAIAVFTSYVRTFYQ